MTGDPHAFLGAHFPSRTSHNLPLCGGVANLPARTPREFDALSHYWVRDRGSQVWRDSDPAADSALGHIGWQCLAPLASEGRALLGAELTAPLGGQRCLRVQEVLNVPRSSLEGGLSAPSAHAFKHRRRCRLASRCPPPLCRHGFNRAAPPIPSAAAAYAREIRGVGDRSLLAIRGPDIRTLWRHVYQPAEGPSRRDVVRPKLVSPIILQLSVMNITDVRINLSYLL